MNNRVLKHLIYFLFLFLLIYGLDFFFRPSHKDFVRTIFICLGCTLGMPEILGTLNGGITNGNFIKAK